MTTTTERWLYGAVSLSLTVGIIFFGISLYSRINEASTAAKDKLTKAVTDIEERDIVNYENRIVRGALLPGYIQTIYHSVPTIYLKKATTTNIGSSSSIQETALYPRLINSADSLYLSPDGKFFITIQRNSSQQIVSVTITLQ